MTTTLGADAASAPRLLSDPLDEPDVAPTLTVAIPTYNRRDRLHRVLTGLAAQDVDAPFEVIVVSDGSSDGTDEYLASGATPLPIQALSQPNQGPAAARNLAIERARADLIVFLDDDVVPTPDLLRRHLAAHQQRGPNCVVIGPMRAPADHRMSSWVAWEQEMLDKQYDAMERGDYTATARQFYTGNASVRTGHLRAAGGFDVGLQRAEDIELAFRLDDLGLEFSYEPEACGLHYAERTFASWLGVAASYGKNDVRFARDGRPELFTLITWIFQQRKLPLRIVAWFAALGAGPHAMCRWAFQPLIHPFPEGRRGRATRYALSALYAAEYYAAARNELGSFGDFRSLMTQRRPTTT